MKTLPRVLLNGVWYFRDDRLREYPRGGNPHERITFDELLPWRDGPWEARATRGTCVRDR